MASGDRPINSLLYRAREVVKGSVAVASPDPDDPAVQTLLARYVGAWELADISEFVATVSDDARFFMPPMPTWYEGSDSVAAFVEAAIFGPARPHGVPVATGRANGQPALGVYMPVPSGTMRIDGLQVLDVDPVSNTITAITSFRDPDLAQRCRFPAVRAN